MRLMRYEGGGGAALLLRLEKGMLISLTYHDS
jgi:hypothetical protein